MKNKTQYILNYNDLNSDEKLSCMSLLYSFYDEAITQQHFQATYEGDVTYSTMELVSHPERGLVLVTVVEDDDSTLIPIGVIVVAYVPYLFSKERYAAELVWYVSPDYRNSPTGIRLLKEAEEIIRETQSSIKYLACSSMGHLDLTKMYERLGFRKYEVSMVKELMPIQHQL